MCFAMDLVPHWIYSAYMCFAMDLVPHWIYSAYMYFEKLLDKNIFGEWLVAERFRTYNEMKINETK